MYNPKNNKKIMDSIRAIDLDSLARLYCKLNVIVLSENKVGLQPGLMKNENGFYSIFASAMYIDDPLDFFAKMYISLINNHVFNDGNKRTALYMFSVMLFPLEYKIVEERNEDISNATILYLEKEISEGALKNLILDSLENTESTDDILNYLYKKDYKG